MMKVTATLLGLTHHSYHPKYTTLEELRHLHITIDKTEVLDLLFEPMLQLEKLRKTMEGQVVELVSQHKPTAWWDLLGKVRRRDSMAVMLAELGTSSVHQVVALYAHLENMRYLAEMSTGPVHVTHKDLLHVVGARKLCAAVDNAKRGMM